MVRTRSSLPPAAARPRALVVDDVPANLLALETLLEGLECDVRCARSGAEALSLLLRETFAVMLLDVRMPGMDGYEVARHARMHSATRDVPIIFMTAESPTEEHLMLGYDAGAVDYLFKPVSREIVRSKVRVFMDLYESRRELRETNRRLESANAKLLELVDEEAAAASALRQANDELGVAFRDWRATQSQLIQTTELPSLNALSDELARGDSGPVTRALEKLDEVDRSLSRLLERGWLAPTPEARAEWEAARSNLSAASDQLGRMTDEGVELKNSAVLRRIEPAPEAPTRERRQRSRG